MTHRSESELVRLRKTAELSARQRKERPTTVHLLASIAAHGGSAADLLFERRLDRDGLLKAGRSFDEDASDAMARALSTARDISKRSSHTTRGERRALFPEPNALHLLLALLSERRSAAHRALVQSGVDVSRLRTAALQIAIGLMPSRRAVSAPMQAEPVQNATSRGVTVPLLPDSVSPKSSPSSRPSANPAAPDKTTPRAREPRRAETVPLSLPRVPPPAAASKKTRLRPAAKPPKPGKLTGLEDMPTLASIGIDLTAMAERGELETVIGRDAEIDRALDVLSKRRANAPVLVGPAGVGKTAVAHGMAQRLCEATEGGRQLIELRVAELIAGTGTRGSLADRLSEIRKEVRGAKGRVILFIDEIHELFGGVADEAVAELKVALSNGELPLIGATTPAEFRKVIEPDAALSRRFTVIEIDEPNEADAFLLIQRVCEGLGSHHGVSYTDEAIASCIAWSQRYVPGRALPDKAIAVLDLAGAQMSRRAKQDGSLAREIDPAAVASIMTEMVDVPEERLLESDHARMLNLESFLAERVIGHSAALKSIATHLRRNAAGLRGRRPIGTFLLLGPTGVGKTETAKAIAEALFDSADAMTRLDMSEYSEAHAVARLVGAPPGYVGHESGGQLTEALRRRPYQVILLDEIEKAHRDVLEAFLPVFDEGHLTDGRGRRVDFTNAVVVLTSNLGAMAATNASTSRAVGFTADRQTSDRQTRVREAVIASARHALPPELFNRFDEVLCFSPLSREEVASIARQHLDALCDVLSLRGISLSVDAEAIEALLDAGGFDPSLGARPMRRTIARLIEAPLSDLLLRGQLSRGGTALVTVDVTSEGPALCVDALPRQKVS